MAAVTKEALMSHLQRLGITLRLYEHPIVMTIEDQSKHLGHLEGIVSKNLFLKDKKGRLYLVSALATTNVDLKALSQRLGLGKGGLRMAPEDALQEVLKVPLGSVTPFALINPSARSVILLLDHQYQHQSKLFFHPLVNDSTLEITNNEFNMFLKSIGRGVPYVDLEAVVAVGKDQPPDLAGFITESKPLTPDMDKSTIVIHNPSSTQESVKAVLPISMSKVVKNEKPPDEGSVQKLVGDPQRLLKYILDETLAKTMAKVKAEVGDQISKEQELSILNEVKNQVGPGLESIIMLFKNTAYTQGYAAGRTR